jgi:hypothetical protein
MVPWIITLVVEVNGTLHTSTSLPPEKAPSTQWIGWVVNKAYLDAVEKRKISVFT